MSNFEQIDFSTLIWVKKELDETLKRAQSALEEYVENPEDENQLQFCATYLHQVQGTLKMVELYGAAMVAEEMEQVAKKILNKEVDSEKDAFEVLMEGIILLPDYLERIQLGHKDIPMILLPLVNDLRTVKGDQLLSESALFNPDLSLGIPESKFSSSFNLSQNQLILVIKKIRSAYQICLLNWLKDVNVDENLKKLQIIVDKLKTVISSTDEKQLFWVAGGLFEALISGGIEKSVTIKQLAARLDQAIRFLITNDNSEELPYKKLTNNLLYYVALADSKDRRINEIQTFFKLSNFISDDQEIEHAQSSLSGKNRDLLESVTVQIKEDLMAIQESLDLFNRNDSASTSDLKQIVGSLTKLSDTLGIIGIGIARSKLRDDIELLEQSIKQDQLIDDDTIMHVAETLLFVESALNENIMMLGEASKTDETKEESLIPTSEMKVIMDSLAKESIQNLQKVKQNFVMYIEAPWNKDSIQSSPKLLKDISGALKMSGFDKVAAELDRIEEYTSNYMLSTEYKPTVNQLDLLAESIASLEYYLEYISEGVKGEDRILDLAKSNIELLFDSVEKLEAQKKTNVNEDLDQMTDDDFDMDLDDSFDDLDEFDDELKDDEEIYNDLLNESDATDGSKQLANDEFDYLSMDNKDRGIQTSNQKTTKVIEVPKDQELIVRFSDETDDDIKEVFLEEFEEELEHLVTIFPKWLKNPEEQVELLGEIRRIYHTLKGSGRLVGALAIGDYSWRIEDMINLILNNSLEMNESFFMVMQSSSDILPKLFQALQNQSNVPEGYYEIIYAAETVIKGQEITAEDLIPKTDLQLSETEESSVEKIELDDYIENTEVVDSDLGIDENQDDLITETEAIGSDTVEIIDEIDTIDFDVDDLEEELSSEEIEETDVTSSEDDEVEEIDEFDTIDFDVDDLEDDLSDEETKETDVTSSEDDEVEEIDEIDTIDFDVDDLEDELSSEDIDATDLTSSEDDELEEIDTIDFDVDDLEDELSSEDIDAADVTSSEDDEIEGIDTIDFDVDNLEDELSSEDIDAADVTSSEDDEVEEIDEIDTIDFDVDGLEDELLSEDIDATDITSSEDDEVEEIDEIDTIDFDVDNLEDELSSEDIDVADATDVTSFEDDEVEEIDEIDTIDFDVDDLEDELSSEDIDAVDVTSSEDNKVEEIDEIDSIDFDVDEPEEKSTKEETEAISDDIEIGESNIDGETITETSEEGESDEQEKEGFEIDEPNDRSDVLDDLSVDPVFVEILQQEVEGHLNDILQYIENTQLTNNTESTEQFVRVIHTLNGAANMASVNSIVEMTTPLELSAKLTNELNAKFSDETITKISEFREEASNIMKDLSKNSESNEVSSGISKYFKELFSNLETEENLDSSEISDDFDLTQFIDESDEVENESGQESESIDDITIDDLILDTDETSDDEGLEDETSEDETSEDEVLEDETSEDEASEDEESEEEISEDETLEDDTSEDESEEIYSESEHISAINYSQEGNSETAEQVHEFDEELLEIFKEEADDILDKTEHVLSELEENPKDTSLILTLQRDLHTLKGGARMAGMENIGELSHVLESLLEVIGEENRKVDTDIINVIHESFDLLNKMKEEDDYGQSTDISNTINKVRHLIGLDDDTILEESKLDLNLFDAIDAMGPGDETDVVDSIEGGPDTSIKKQSNVLSGNQIKVNSELLDNLVNYAGEVSIYRSRLEQEIGSFRVNLSELGNTVARIREQLRKLDVETEAQIISTFQTESEHDEGFDPLEMDRFSMLQQLSRSLTESVSDLTSIHSYLDDVARTSDNLLTQQSRVNTELQEGLMETRLVSFNSIVPRLRRLVRTTSQELDKPVKLDVSGAEGEMDKTVLEGIIAPLEHMLRNSLAHGIEEDRDSAGKKEMGSISIDVRREATEVIISVIDDGAGINRDKVKELAVSKGIINKDSTISDENIDRLILNSGFSTVDKVSKLAGRGVGMDVVSNQINLLGGTLDISSEPTKGTKFGIRLPYTLALSSALLVEISETVYAIPVSGLEGIIRMSYPDYLRKVKDQDFKYEYANEEYQLHELNTLLDIESEVIVENNQIPLVMIRSGENGVALRVDKILGSREIVIKTVGSQISSVPGILGATILGDGNVVLILDIIPLSRSYMSKLESLDETAQVVEQIEIEKDPIIMIVDDSITMRKVGERILRRNNFDVVTAKDGLDALENLSEIIPDVMLLDIEMPRMDGYELAIEMKKEEKYANIPIIMITSRTGDKHRQKAMDLGVDRYLGKPYQEADLLENIRDLLEEDTD